MDASMSGEAADHVICATYTHARRHPLVIGNIAGWTPPFQLSLPQLAVLAVAFWFEMQTWHLWGGHLPRSIGIVVAVCIPCAVAWAVRRARVEGRTLARAAAGYIAWLSTPRHGRVRGRPLSVPGPRHAGRRPIYVERGVELS
jgi:hypothetical protein